MIAIPHVFMQTALVFGVLLVAIMLSKRQPATKLGLFPVTVTQELKGLAILLVYFSHIGNFLVADQRFLSPLSGASQVGVDLFLILSGYGLTVSNLKRPQKPFDFYKRLSKLFKPFWIVLTVVLLLDVLVLGLHYGWGLVLLSYCGIFLTSNLGQDINAPFWFITFITVYYLLFPLVFRKQRVWLSAGLLLLIGAGLTLLNPPVLSGVMFLYKLHYLAFPAGMVLASALSKRPQLSVAGLHKSNLRYAIIGFLLLGLFVINPHQLIDGPALVRQLGDLACAAILMLMFIIKRSELRLLHVLGVSSFELYLLHWPLVSRYDVLFAHLPAWLATLLYLPIIIGLGVGLQRLAGMRISTVGRLAK